MLCSGVDGEREKTAVHMRGFVLASESGGDCCECNDSRTPPVSMKEYHLHSFRDDRPRMEVSDQAATGIVAPRTGVRLCSR